jgi:hypothetical protein
MFGLIQSLTYGLFNDTVSISDYKTPKIMEISECRIGDIEMMRKEVAVA